MNNPVQKGLEDLLINFIGKQEEADRQAGKFALKALIDDPNRRTENEELARRYVAEAAAWDSARAKLQHFIDNQLYQLSIDLVKVVVPSTARNV